MKLVFTHKALKQLQKLDRVTQTRIREALDTLLTQPKKVDLKKLKGQTNKWRIRVGSYRVILRFYKGQCVILVLQIAHRKDIYKN